MVTTRDRTKQSIAASIFVLVLVGFFLCGVGVAAQRSLTADGPDPTGMPMWLAQMVAAINVGLSANLGLELGKRFGNGRFPTGAKPLSQNWNLFYLGFAYLIAWITATLVWVLTGFKTADQTVAIIPEISTTGLEIFAGLAVTLMAVQSVSPRVRAWFD